MTASMPAEALEQITPEDLEGAALVVVVAPEGQARMWQGAGVPRWLAARWLLLMMQHILPADAHLVAPYEEVTLCCNVCDWKALVADDATPQDVLSLWLDHAEHSGE